MAKSRYDWKIGKSFPLIQQHSVVKHEIIREYLIDYIKTHTSNPRMEFFKLVLIDGFSGGGVYTHADNRKEIVGSPFILLEAVREAEHKINIDRRKKIVLDFDYIFIEKDQAAAKHLEYVLKERGYGSLINKNIFLFNSSFEDRADEVIAHVQKRIPNARKSIFLLDQYGYTDVQPRIIRKILHTLPGSEIIFTFAIDSLLRYITDKGDKAKKLLETNEIPESLRGRTIEDIKKSEPDSRLYIQSCLYPELIKRWEAKFFTLFFIRSEKAHGDYWLIHLSQKPRARDVMTSIHWKKNTNFIHYGGPGLNMFTALGYMAKYDTLYTQQSNLDLGFKFDDSAKEKSINALIEQIPELIYPERNGITFLDMFSKTCNMSPASEKIYREAIDILINSNDLLVIGSDGSSRRSAKTIKKDDIIFPSKQSKFNF